MDTIPVHQAEATSAAESDPGFIGSRWRPQPVVAGSIGLHVAVPAGLWWSPDAWPWAAAAIAANHFALCIAGMCPRSRLLGPNLTRLPEAAVARREISLTFDDGPDPDVTPKVLDVLDARGVRATFFCIADRAERHPALCQDIARRGHAIENHSRSHSPAFAMRGLRGLRNEIECAQGILENLSRRRPRFFRPPAGLRNPLLDPVLHTMGLRLVTWSRRGFDTRRKDPGRVVARLVDGLGAGDIVLMHDGHAARTPSGTPIVLEVLPRVLDRIESLGLRPVTLHDAIEP